MTVISIGELSERTRVNIETIRYYEKAGVIPRPSRTEGGHRAYDDKAFRRLNFIRRCRELGFSLNEVRLLLRLVDGDNVTCEEVREITFHHLTNIRNRIADLHRMEKTLEATVTRCAGDRTADCPILEGLFSDKLKI